MYGVYKQAIYNRTGKVEFYEVFLQDIRTGAYPEGVDPLKATSLVIETLTEMGPKNIGENKRLFVNVPAIFLEASMFDLLPPKYIGIELVENARLNNNVYKAIDHLLKKGFKFCIDNFGFEKIDYLPLLGKCHFVKMDIKKVNYDEDELREVIGIVKSLGRQLIAKKVETEEEYRKLVGLGFDHFQGFYLSKPVRIKDAKVVSFVKTTLFKLYQAIKNTDINSIIETLEKDIGATYKLLKFVNSAYFPKIREISDVREAVAYLGFENIVKFTIIIALSEVFTGEKDISNWKRALFRAVLMERLAQIYNAGLKSKAYLAGLFSVSSEILGQHPEEVARELTLDKEIVEAYEGRPNELRFLLSLTYLLEDNPTEDMFLKVASRLSTSPQSIKNIVEEAKREAQALLSYTS